MAGMEVFFALAKTSFRSRNDALVAFVHYTIIKAKWKNIGKGEEVPASIKQTELLPTGWNEEQDCYALLYQPEVSAEAGDIHTLKIIPIDGILLVHFGKLQDENIRTLDVKVVDYVAEEISTFEDTYKDLNKLEELINKALLGPPKKEKVTKEVPSTTASRENTLEDRLRSSDDPLRVPCRANRVPRPSWQDYNDPFAVGGADLNPFNHQGGGMFMDPRRGMPGFGDPSAGLPGRLPRGAVPPGARFDPFGPPDFDRSGNFNPFSGHRSGPDPDHMRPPDDDMFM